MVLTKQEILFQHRQKARNSLQSVSDLNFESHYQALNNYISAVVEVIQDEDDKLTEVQMKAESHTTPFLTIILQF